MLQTLHHNFKPKKMKTKSVLVGGLLIGGLSHLHAQVKPNKISPNDPELKIECKYSDPYKIMYNFGATVGVDGSTTSAALFADFSGFFTMKHFIVRSNYSIDLTKKNFVSNNHPLGDKFGKYSNFQVSGFFNTKDEIKEVTVEPMVGFEETDRETDNFKGTVKMTGYFYNTDQVLKIRKTFGLGGSLILNSGNTYSTEKSDGSHITFKNPNLAPQEFVLPYSAVTVGVGLQSSQFKAFNYKYTYKNLKPYKLKEKYFRIITLELLFAPSIRHDQNIWVSTNNVAFQTEVEDVKKMPFGIRTLLIQNFYSGKKRAHKPGIYTNVELGMRPGIYNKTFPESLYFRFGVGVTI